MLHYNDTGRIEPATGAPVSQAGAEGRRAHAHADKAHVAHAMVVAIHILCCGLPAAFALFGATMGVLAVGGVLTRLHNWLHGYEGVVLGISAFLVLAGGTAEWLRRRTRTTFPVLFAISVACLALNASVVMAHWAFSPAAQAKVASSQPNGQ